MTLSLASCGKETEKEPTVEETPVTTRVAALKGPTAMGMVKLMSDNEAAAEEGGEEDAAQGGYEFTLAASADEVTPSLMKGEMCIRDRAKKLGHVSNLFYTEPAARLAEILCKRTGESCVFFANGGGEANEGMIKLARKYSFDKYGKGRATIITLNNSLDVYKRQAYNLNIIKQQRLLGGTYHG